MANLKTSYIGRPLHYFPEIPSTNSWLKQNVLIQETGTVAVTDNQTQGKGQYKREWITAPRANLAFSVLLRPGNPKYMHSVTLVAALAACDALKPMLGERCCVKWPNDIYFKGKKIAGILVESTFTGDKLDKLILGVGINVNQLAFPSNLPDAGSVRMAKSDLAMLPREEILANYLNALEERLNRWEVKPSSIRKEVNYRLIGYSCYGKLQVGSEILSGTYKFMGINDDGFPVFLDSEADICVYRSEQIRFQPDGKPSEPIVWNS
ncbi:MAG: biotin--[acetyl-CoA-carboxylase] ligase [Bacteroidetes bacterium]|nr:biotin--[acetyl-CoA-carboxylase] ligase [Bacteroidota bacterium]MCH8523561.1 biotin--[acetyl-CoA-carboxylase] ligase [Balneolales bacterium]